METDGTKIVFFDEYCPTCEYFDKDGSETPCDECLSNPVNQYSHKPVKWKDANES